MTTTKMTLQISYDDFICEIKTSTNKIRFYFDVYPEHKHYLIIKEISKKYFLENYNQQIEIKYIFAIVDCPFDLETFSKIPYFHCFDEGKKGICCKNYQNNSAIFCGRFKDVISFKKELPFLIKRFGYKTTSFSMGKNRLKKDKYGKHFLLSETSDCDAVFK